MMNPQVKKAAVRVAQYYSSGERLSALDPGMVIVFGKIIVEAIGLIGFCRGSNKSAAGLAGAAMAYPTDEEKRTLRELIKNALGDEHSHLTDRVFDAIIRAGNSLKPEEMESLIDSAK